MSDDIEFVFSRFQVFNLLPNKTNCHERQRNALNLQTDSYPKRYHNFFCDLDR